MKKNWWQSWTIWAGLAEIAVALADWGIGLFNAGEAPGWILSISGAAKIFLRLKTSSGISAPGGNAPPPRSWTWMIALVALAPLLPAETALWECVQRDIGGNPAAVAEYELAIAPTVVDIATSPQLAQMRRFSAASTARAGGECGIDITDWISSLPATPWSIYCRAYNSAGDPGPWSERGILGLPRVKGLKVRVIIEVETPGTQ